MWSVVYPYVPGGGAVRVVARVGLFLLIPAAIGLAWFLQGVRRPAVALAVVLLCALEQVRVSGAFDKEQHRRDVGQIARRVPPGCQAFFCVRSDPSLPAWKLQLDAMWAQLEANRPTVNAYFGKSPPGYEVWAYEVYTPERAPGIEEGLRGWLRGHHAGPGEVPVILVDAEEGEGPGK